jgi:hypothetical protein
MHGTAKVVAGNHLLKAIYVALSFPKALSDSSMSVDHADKTTSKAGLKTLPLS